MCRVNYEVASVPNLDSGGGVWGDVPQPRLARSYGFGAELASCVRALGPGSSQLC